MALIPGLPDEIALECLVRVPITSHPTLRQVSATWNAAVSHPSFFSDRRRLGSADQLIFLIQPLTPQPPQTTKDAVPSPPSSGGAAGPPPYCLNVYNFTRREWRRVSSPPIPMFAHCVAVPPLGKVVVLGGWDPVTLEPVDDVIVIDVARGDWRKGAAMPAARSFFACTAAVEGGAATVYIAGGHDGQKNALRSAAAYDVAADTWRVLPDMIEERDECHGVALKGGNFVVISGYGTESQGRFRSDAEVFDQESESWSKIEGVWPYAVTSPKYTALALPGRWMRAGEGEVREFEWEERRWKRVNTGRVPKRVSGSSTVSLIDAGDGRVMVVGNGGGEGVCEEGWCGGEGVFVLLEKERCDCGNNKGDGGATRWEHVHAPSRFLGFPFSSSQLLI